VEISVSSRNVELSDGLRAAAIEKLTRLSRYLEGMDRAEIHIYEERNPRITAKDVCEVTLEGHGHHVRAKVAAPDPVAAIDACIDKIEHQLHRLKTRLVGRSHPRRQESVHSPQELDGLGASGESNDDDRPRIVKTKQFAIKPMTPEEAALQMELLGHDFFFFTNADTGKAAVVYRRNEGDVGLIDEAG
jgi:putative sigma-54 modulation protein